MTLGKVKSMFEAFGRELPRKNTLNKSFKSFNAFFCETGKCKKSRADST